MTGWSHGDEGCTARGRGDEMRMAGWLIVATEFLSRAAEAQDRYAYYLGLGEQAKQAADFPRMEQAIRQALRYGAR